MRRSFPAREIWPRTRATGMDAEQRFQQLGAAGAHQPRDAKDFAAAHGEGNLAQRRGRPASVGEEAEVLYPQGLLFHRGDLFRIEVVQGCARPSSGSTAGGRLGDREGPDVLPVSQDGDAVGDAENLVQLVGDVDHGDAMLLQRGDDREKPVDLRLTQRGRRLVQDEKLGVERERFGDFDELLLAHAQPLDRAVRGDVQVEAVEECL